MALGGLSWRPFRANSTPCDDNRATYGISEDGNRVLIGTLGYGKLDRWFAPFFKLPGVAAPDTRAVESARHKTGMIL